MTVFDDLCRERVDGLADLECDEPCPRHHDLSRDGFLELKDVEEELGLIDLDGAALTALLDELLDLERGEAFFFPLLILRDWEEALEKERELMDGER